ncbi:MAG TPA: Sua5/YciO/YrdC/YwlC family protein [Saprospiraceae bacterium]|nr:Sua5/YciO/YrdC/YwlC family protein [Saprospiraceae bacterium]
MMNHYECDIAIKALLAEKIILFPTDTVWSMACLPAADQALWQILELKREKRAENFELLFYSLDQLRQYCPRLHPRLDTLLAFHERPLTVALANLQGLPEALYNHQGLVNIRVVKQRLSQQLIRAVEQPLVSTPASVNEDQYPRNFGAIPSNFLQTADYIMKIRQRDVMEEDQLSVKVRLNAQGELIFLRE